MRLGKIPPIPEDDSPWCPFDLLEAGDYFPVFDFKGSCPNCGTIDVPYKIHCQYVGNSLGDVYHIFIPIEEIHCAGCGGLLNTMSLLCGKKSVDVTGEFLAIRK